MGIRQQNWIGGSQSMSNPPLEIYTRSLDKWGVRLQEDMFIEESAEAVLAVSHFRRDKCDMDTVCGELADLWIMLEQMRIVFGTDRFDRIFAKKVVALYTKLDEQKPL